MQIPPSLPPERLHHYVVSTSVHNNVSSPSRGLIAMFNTDVSLSPSLIFFSIYLTFLCRGGIRLQEEKHICAFSTAPPAKNTHTHTANIFILYQLKTACSCSSTDTVLGGWITTLLTGLAVCEIHRLLLKKCEVLWGNFDSQKEMKGRATFSYENWCLREKERISEYVVIVHMNGWCSVIRQVLFSFCSWSFDKLWQTCKFASLLKLCLDSFSEHKENEMKRRNKDAGRLTAWNISSVSWCVSAHCCSLLRSLFDVGAPR